MAGGVSGRCSALYIPDAAEGAEKMLSYRVHAKLQIAIAAHGGCDLIAVGVLFSPLVGSAESRRVSMSELSVGLQRKNARSRTLRNLDQKIVLARIRSASSTRTIREARFELATELEN